MFVPKAPMRTFLLRGWVAAFATFNWLAAPVAIVWLIVLGEWWAIGLAVLSLFAPTILGIALMPLMVLGAPALRALTQKRSRLAILLSLPSLIYTAALITVWCVGVFVFLLVRARSETWVPLMLLAYSIGTAPLTYIVSHEERRGTSDTAIIFMHLAFIIVMAYFAIARPETSALLWWIFGTIMAAEVGVAMWEASRTLGG